MNVLITGAKGFIGKNLIATLKYDERHTILEYDVDCEPALLGDFTNRCDFVFHLAGVNRPKDEKEFSTGNTRFTEILLAGLQENNNTAPVVISSSTQAGLDNPYGQSKKAAEQLVFEHAGKMNSAAYVYRLPNVFGKWCRPNYNSVVATFCHNIAHGLPITVNDPETVMNLVYIDDVAAEFISALNSAPNRSGQFCAAKPVYTVKLGEIAALLKGFRESRNTLQIPDLADGFSKKLYSTYLSYMPENEFAYPLNMHKDDRGSFTEFLRTPERGQVSVNISRPGITKGNHWHHSKNEKFLVVSGEGVIRLRKVGSDSIFKYHVNGGDLKVIDIPPGYTHNIENLGDTDMVTVMWVNECFDPEKPDTYTLQADSNQ